MKRWRRAFAFTRQLPGELLLSFMSAFRQCAGYCKIMASPGRCYKSLLCNVMNIFDKSIILDVSVFSPEKLVFVDETGADRKNTIRKYGYSMRGKPLSSPIMLVRGVRVSAITCISIAGVLDVMTVQQVVITSTSLSKTTCYHT